MLRFLLPQIQSGTWAEISALVFMVLFLAIALWTYWPSARKYYEERGRLPLDDGRKGED